MISVNLLRDKFYSVMNILGLAIALVCTIFIFLYVTDEMSHDHFHEHSNQIYRVVCDNIDQDGNTSAVATTAPALAGLLQKELPEVDYATRIFPTNGRKTIFRVNEKSFYEEGMYDTDSSIFRVFTFPLIKGNLQTALRSPEDVVLTESIAKKYFGELDALGQRITVQDQYLGVKELTVTAVVRDVPLNSHFRFDMLRPATFMIAPQNLDDSWGFAAFHTYLKVKEGTNLLLLQQKIQQVVQRHNPDNKNKYSLQPIEDIHLHSKLKSEIGANGDIKNVVILITIGILITIVAIINYINFSLAKAITRAKEVGVRKITGAPRLSLVKQFLGESIQTSFASLLVALIGLLLLLPVFNHFTGKHFTYTLNGNFFAWGCILVITLVVGFLSGIYPALYLSSLSPITALRKNAIEIKSFWGLRNVLMSLQFITSVSLIICTGVIMKQATYVRNAKLGFEPQQVIVIPDIPGTVNLSAFRQQLAQFPQIVSMGVSSGMISKNNWHGYMLTRNSPTEIPVTMCNVDSTFFRTLGLRLLKWNNISTADSVGGIVINETAVKRLGFTQPIGEEILWPRDHRPLKIIGVVEDFHFESLHSEISPFAFQLLSQFLSNLFIRTQTADLPRVLEKIQEAWKQTAPGQPLQYFFMDNYVEKQYQAEMKFKTIISVAAGIAILIAFIGLLGLTALVVKNKSKEIGIRKVLGASPGSLVNLLTKKLLVILLISNTIALPIAYIAMENWLSGFAYHILLNASPGAFLFPPFGVITLALVTLSLLVLKTASTNPVQVIRNE